MLEVITETSKTPFKTFLQHFECIYQIFYEVPPINTFLQVPWIHGIKIQHQMDETALKDLRPSKIRWLPTKKFIKIYWLIFYWILFILCEYMMGIVLLYIWHPIIVLSWLWTIFMGQMFYINQLCTPFFPIGLFKTECGFIVTSVETGLGRWTLVVAVWY